MTSSPVLPLWEAYRMHTSPDAYTFEPTMGGDGAPAKEYLTIHRRTGSDADADADDDDVNDVKSHFSLSTTAPPRSATATAAPLDVLGILGVIPLHTTSFLVVITSRSHVTTLLDAPIYMATDFRVFPIANNADRHHPIEKTLLGLLKSHLYSAPFYFSYRWDLTSSLQRQSQSQVAVQAQAQQASTSPSPPPAWQRADERFFWNRYLCQPLIDATTSGTADLSRFILPCIFGFLSIKNATVGGHDFLFGLVARRSRHRAGTRYFSRGIDADGNVSNFNETEQFVILDPPGSPAGKIRGTLRFSYVQTRGSVPVYWAEVNNLRYKPDLVVMTGDKQRDTAAATARHFERQVALYGDNYLVNLVNQSGYEKPVKEAYERAVQDLANDRLHYVYYDFHHECKGMKFEKVWGLVERLEALGLGAHDWFHYDASQRRGGDVDAASAIVKQQHTVVRTNCMDCLDRTNVVQATLARWVLTYQLRQAGVLGQTEIVDGDAKFMHLFRNVWADHADGVSRAYSGTGALKTDFTRTGKRSTEGAIQDGVNSITRYVKNNFLDGPRQDAYDVFTGSWTPRRGVPGTKRSLATRAMPYVALFSLLMVLAGFLLPRGGAAPSASVSASASASSGSPAPPILPTWTYLTLWCTLLGFSLRFILDRGVEFVAFPTLNRAHYDELIRYDGSGWSSGRNGRGPREAGWGGNRRGGRWVGEGEGEGQREKGEKGGGE